MIAPGTRRRIDLLFAEADRPEAMRWMLKECDACLRIQYAVLKVSEGTLSGLREAIKLKNLDWRDLFVAAGFEHDVKKHLSWLPEPRHELIYSLSVYLI